MCKNQVEIAVPGKEKLLFLDVDSQKDSFHVVARPEDAAVRGDGIHACHLEGKLHDICCVHSLFFHWLKIRSNAFANSFRSPLLNSEGPPVTTPEPLSSSMKSRTERRSRTLLSV